MYKVIIADDEPLLRFALRNLIAWEEHGFTIVGEAKDGFEALQMSLEWQADLIFTDIRMPNMDGLEFIGQLRQNDPHVSVVVLSNYDDFAFVQKALRNSVDDYILKSSMCADQMLQILETEKRKIESKARHKTTKDEIPIGTVNHAGILKQIIDEKSLPTVLAEKEQSFVHELFDTRYFVAYLMDYDADNLYRNYSAEDITLLNNLTLDILHNMLHDRSRFFLTKDVGCVLILHEAQFADYTPESFLQRLVDLAECYTNRKFLVGISSCGYGFEQFLQKYHESQCALDYRFYDDDMRIYDYVKAEYTNEAYDIHVLFKYVLKQLSEPLWWINVQKAISDIFEQIAIIKPSSVDCKRLFVCALSMLSTKLAEESEELYLQTEWRQQLVIENLRHANTLAYLRGQVDVYIEEMNRAISATDNFSMIVNNAILHIREHYAEKISLESIAKQVAVHPNYLSRIFAKQTGKSFVTFLTEYRIVKAKALLKNRSLTIQQVGDRVGIPNYKYFSDVFKKICHYPPQEYRQRHYHDQSS